MAYFGILARVHTQQVSEESYSEPEFVPRFSLAKLKLEPGYKSWADPVCRAGSHCFDWIYRIQITSALKYTGN